VKQPSYEPENMGGIAKYHREARRLSKLAEQATTAQVRQVLLQQAKECEAVAFELEILAQRAEAERLAR
jgi:hypothetical protein